MQPRLATVSPHFLAVPKKVGGSLFRIYRDTRFSADKTPYKTHLGVHFRHDAGGDVHTPGFYLHVEPGGSFFGAGIWHPDPPTLARLRDAIVASPSAWRAARAATEGAGLPLGGETTSRMPRGYPKDHEAAGDLMRKDVICSRELSREDVLADDLPDRFVGWVKGAAPLVRWTCAAIGQPF